MNVVVAVSRPPSDTVILMSVVPLSPLAGVTTIERLEPLPLIEIPELGTRRLFDEVAETVKLAPGVSESSIVNEMAGEAFPASITCGPMNETFGG